MSNELFVGNLNPKVHIRDLENVFGRYGRIERCDLKKNFGFIQFVDRRDAEEAIKKENNRRLLGSEMTVEWAKGSAGDSFGGPPGGFRKPRSPMGRRPRSPFGGGMGRGRGRDRSPMDRNGFSGPPRFSPRGGRGGRGRRSFDGPRDFDGGSRFNRGPPRDRFNPRNRFDDRDSDRFDRNRGPPPRERRGSSREFNDRPRGDRFDRRDSFSDRPNSFRGPRRF